MGLLDGDSIKNALGGVMAAVYASGKLWQITRFPDGEGGWTTAAHSYPAKVQENLLSETQRAAAGYSEKEAQIFVLQKGMTIEPTTGDKIEIRGTIFAVSRVEADPGRSHWVCRCERTELTASEIGGAT